MSKHALQLSDDDISTLEKIEKTLALAILAETGTEFTNSKSKFLYGIVVKLLRYFNDEKEDEN